MRYEVVRGAAGVLWYVWDSVERAYIMHWLTPTPRSWAKRVLAQKCADRLNRQQAK